jgi:putative transcriptional regulator
MSVRNLWLFTMLGIIVGFAAGERSNQSGKEPGLPALSTKSGLLQTVLVPAQFKNAEGLAAGKVLVASRDLADPNFAQTVILLVRYDAQGVVGLVLNRRTRVPLSRVLEDLKAAKDRSDPVYLGGPVETPAVFALFQSPNKMKGAEQIFAGIYLITAKALFEQTISTRPDPGVFHVYLGYAGWNKEQLRKEVELGAWFIFPPDASTVFNSDPDSLWKQMIGKTELKLAGNEPANTNPGDTSCQVVAVS